MIPLHCNWYSPSKLSVGSVGNPNVMKARGRSETATTSSSWSIHARDCKRNVIEHSCSTAPLKSPWCAIHIVQRHTHLFIPLISDAHTDSRAKRCSMLLVNSLPITLNTKIDLHMCFIWTSVINLALFLEQHSHQL